MQVRQLDLGIPNVAAVVGPAVGLGAARAASCHFSVMAGDIGALFNAGPKIVEGATFEDLRYLSIVEPTGRTPDVSVASRTSEVPKSIARMASLTTVHQMRRDATKRSRASYRTCQITGAFYLRSYRRLIPQLDCVQN
jgi:hypothetical protein